jgi:thiol-disulfide isomerase/thioredoxin
MIQLPNIDFNTSWVSEVFTRHELLNKKYLLVFVWSLSCSHCKDVALGVIRFQQHHADQLNILYLHVPLDDQDLEFSRVLQQAGEVGMHGPMLMDNEHDFLSALGSRFLPALYLFNHRGQLCSHKIGFEETDQWLLEQSPFFTRSN